MIGGVDVCCGWNARGTCNTVDAFWTAVVVAVVVVECGWCDVGGMRALRGNVSSKVMNELRTLHQPDRESRRGPGERVYMCNHGPSLRSLMAAKECVQKAAAKDWVIECDGGSGMKERAPGGEPDVSHGA